MRRDEFENSRNHEPKAAKLRVTGRRAASCSRSRSRSKSRSRSVSPPQSVFGGTGDVKFEQNILCHYVPEMMAVEMQPGTVRAVCAIQSFVILANLFFVWGWLVPAALSINNGTMIVFADAIVSILFGIQLVNYLIRMIWPVPLDIENTGTLEYKHIAPAFREPNLVYGYRATPMSWVRCLVTMIIPNNEMMNVWIHLVMGGLVMQFVLKFI